MKRLPHGFQARSCRRGFTLIEILVVVAIIALLVSILLPAMSRARAQSRMVMCELHVREMGYALNMYMMDSKDRLPGPLHPAVIRNTRGATNEKQKTFYLPALLRRYYTEAVKGQASMADAIATCPSFPVPDKEFTLNVWGTGPTPFHYVVNTWTNTCSGCNVSGLAVDPGKNLDYYYGFTNAGFQDYAAWATTYQALPGGLTKYGPKKLSNIKFPSKEWAVGDAFRRPYAFEPPPMAGFTSAALPRGTWPREDNSASNSGNPLPKSPFHMEEGYTTQGVNLIYKGRVSTLYFDMHVETRRGFDRFLYNRDEF